MAESSDYKTLKNNMPGPRDRLDRVENAIVPGMPDINFCAEGEECWIEQKSPVEPKRSTTRLFGSNHKMSQDQMNWFKRQVDAGGACFVLIASDKRWMLIEGAHADRINELTVGQLIEIAIWHTTKPVREKEEWKRLRSALQTGLRQSPLRTNSSA